MKTSDVLRVARESGTPVQPALNKTKKDMSRQVLYILIQIALKLLLVVICECGA